MLFYKEQVSRGAIMSKKIKNPAEEIWAILKDVSTSQKEAEERQEARRKEAEERQEAQRKEAEIWRKEIKALQKETEARRKEAEIQHKETEAQVKKTSESLEKGIKDLRKIVGDLGNSWGDLCENLIRGNLAERLKERGIEVEKVVTNIKNEFSEFDIVAINGEEIVVVEVKSKLDSNDVQNFLGQIKKFKGLWPRLSKGKKVYGAMAFVASARPSAVTKAEKAGLFVISGTGDVIIENKKDFKPTAFMN